MFALLHTHSNWLDVIRLDLSPSAEELPPRRRRRKQPNGIDSFTTAKLLHFFGRSCPAALDCVDGNQIRWSKKEKKDAGGC
jgi:hypothetical protein